MNIKKKVCLLGSYGVGKTSLIRRYVHNKFEEKYLSTIGVHISKKLICLNSADGDDYEIELFIWDIANIDKFDSIVKNYLRGAHGAIIVIDVSRPNTIEQIREFTLEFRKLNTNSALTLVGNKIDLIDIASFKKNGMTEFENEFNKSMLLTSAKTGENVEEIFTEIAQQFI